MGKGLVFVALAAVAAGCSSKLETGYEYTKLDMTPSERRAMYADPFSQEAQEAEQDRDNEAQNRRPTNPANSPY